MSEPKKFIDLQFCTDLAFIPLTTLLLFINFTFSDLFLPSIYTSQVSPLVILTHSGTQTSCTSTTGRWKAYYYQNYLINAESIFLYFALSTFSSSSLHLNTEYRVSYFKLTQKCEKIFN
jgi:hypothetical protein